ncbi:hypothetical protein [Frankia sp. AvcI1]|uniref:hypothetical protein n=1 Tax=Frankia sp. AvcI1 TaxID=573496 RepID=UPI002118627D|nr:hypothetical protein [Frankia sp. AvcI1]
MIVADGELREQLALCHAWGIPHSRFLAWPDVDQDKAVAYARFRAECCPQCGTRDAEWDPAEGGDRHAYAAAVHICPGCQTRGDLEHELQDGDEQSGRYVVLIPRAEAERREQDAQARRAARLAAV